MGFVRFGATEKSIKFITLTGCKLGKTKQYEDCVNDNV